MPRLALVAVAATALALLGHGHVLRHPAAVLAAPSLSVPECLEVDAGETFTVSVAVSGVTNLLAWDIYYAYDRKILEVVGKNVRLFLDERPNSNVFDFSDPVPDTDGLYRLGAADTGGKGTEENGSGVLATITLKALAKGVSWSSLEAIDANKDGKADLGPTLTSSGGGHIGDTDGDGVFDGTISSGQIAVGRPCKEPAPTPFVDVDVIPDVSVSTPALSTQTPVPPLDQPTPVTGGATATPAGPQPSEGPPPSPASGARTATPGPPRISGPTGGNADGGGPSPLIAALIGATGGAAVVGGYLAYRTIRRTA